MAKSGKRDRSETESNLQSSKKVPTEEEQYLSAMLFGDSSSLASANKSSSKSVWNDEESQNQGDDDKKTDEKIAAWVDEDDEQLNVNVAETARLRKLRVAHSERILSGTEYSKRLTAHVVSNQGDAKWAEPTKSTTKAKKSKKNLMKDDSDSDNDVSEEEEEDEDLLRDSGSLLQKSSALPSGILGISRLRDANITEPTRAVLQTSQFHPTSPILLTAGLDQTLRFFSVDGKKNSKIASVALHDMPVATAAWNGDGSEVIAAGRRSFFYVYDVSAGKAQRIPRIQGRTEKSFEKFVISPGHPGNSTSLIAFLGENGNAVLCSAKTKQWISNLKMEGQIRSAAFSKGLSGGVGALDYSELLTGGTTGEVYRWDLRTMRCIEKHQTEDAVAVTALAVNPTGTQYAAGNAMGVVNIYDVRGASAALNNNSNKPSSEDGDGFTLPFQLNSFFNTSFINNRRTPAATVMNLTTAVDTLTYHPSGEILMMGSRRIKEQLKLYHVNSGSVFQNWPTNRTPLHFVTSASFSAGGAYVTVGNDKGRALLYRLHHYPTV